jgi:hypothetical protein
MLPHLHGERLRIPRQVPGLKSRGLHGNQQSSRVGHINQSPMHDDSIKTPQAADELVSGLRYQIGCRFDIHVRPWLRSVVHALSLHPVFGSG